MKHKFILKVLVALLLVVNGAVLLRLTGPPEDYEKYSGKIDISLNVPPFVSVANAAPAYQTGTLFLEDEAGVSAYTQIPWAIDLPTVRDLFRTIEYETDQYIIGSVELADYPESHDAHVYVHTDGWVVAYYLAEDPTGKIMDLRHYNGIEITSTKLENALNVICSVVGAVPFEANYYDFRYPNATDIMLIQEYCSSDEGDSFDIQLPNDFTFYERAWAHAYHDGTCCYGGQSSLFLDGNLLNSFDGLYTWFFAYGNLTSAQLYPGSFHTFQIDKYDGDAYGGITLIYQEGP